MRCAHGSGGGATGVRSSVTAVVFSKDNITLVSRGEDACVKVWSIKKPDAPLKVIQNTPNLYPTANVALR
jgi:WD40 repeat protein